MKQLRFYIQFNLQLQTLLNQALRHWGGVLCGQPVALKRQMF